MLNRRELLSLTSATAIATTTSLAGCLETVGLEDGGEVPAYANWLHLNSDQEVSFAHVDWAALEALDGPEADEDPDDWADSEDPMLDYPTLGAFVGILGAGFGLVGTGLTGLTQMDDDADKDAEETTDFETEIEEIIWVNGVIILAGEIDTDEIDAKLTTVPDEEFTLASEYEQTGEIDSFDRYEPVDDEAMGGDVIAVSEEALVFASDDELDARERVQRSIEAHEGDAVVEEKADLEWVLEEAGHGQLVFGNYANDTDSSVDDEVALDHVTGTCSSLELEDDSAIGAFAAIDDELTANAAELEVVLGSSASEAAVDVDDDRVTASATWEEDLSSLQ